MYITEAEYRQVKVETAEGYARVVFETLWQICSWLDFHKLRRLEEDFFETIVRFNDVIPNYLTALLAKVMIPESVLKEAAKHDWKTIIKNNEKRLHNFIWDFETDLPQDRKGVDYFKDDFGLELVKQAGLR